MESSWVMSEEERHHRMRQRAERRARRSQLTSVGGMGGGGQGRAVLKDQKRELVPFEPDPAAILDHMTAEERDEIERAVRNYQRAYSEVPYVRELLGLRVGRPSVQIIAMFTTIIRRFAYFATLFPEFTCLPQQDQEILLRSGILEMSLIRGVQTFDTSNNRWPDTSHTLYHDAPTLHVEDMKKLVSCELYEMHMKFIHSLKELGVDEPVMMLLLLIVLFTSEHPSLLAADLVQARQDHYLHLLRKYVGWRYGAHNAPLLYPRLLLKLTDLRELNDQHNDYNLRLAKKEVTEIQTQLCDLDPASCSPWSPPFHLPTTRPSLPPLPLPDITTGHAQSPFQASAEAYLQPVTLPTEVNPNTHPGHSGSVFPAIGVHQSSVCESSLSASSRCESEGQPIQTESSTYKSESEQRFSETEQQYSETGQSHLNTDQPHLNTIHAYSNTHQPCSKTESFSLEQHSASSCPDLSKSSSFSSISSLTADLASVLTSLDLEEELTSNPVLQRLVVQQLRCSLLSILNSQGFEGLVNGAQGGEANPQRQNKQETHQDISVQHQQEQEHQNQQHEVQQDLKGVLEKAQGSQRRQEGHPQQAMKQKEEQQGMPVQHQLLFHHHHQQQQEEEQKGIQLQSQHFHQQQEHQQYQETRPVYQEAQHHDEPYEQQQQCQDSNFLLQEESQKEIQLQHQLLHHQHQMQSQYQETKALLQEKQNQQLQLQHQRNHHQQQQHQDIQHHLQQQQKLQVPLSNDAVCPSPEMHHQSSLGPQILQPQQLHVQQQHLQHQQQQQQQQKEAFTSQQYLYYHQQQQLQQFQLQQQDEDQERKGVSEVDATFIPATTGATTATTANSHPTYKDHSMIPQSGYHSYHQTLHHNYHSSKNNHNTDLTHLGNYDYSLQQSFPSHQSHQKQSVSNHHQLPTHSHSQSQQESPINHCENQQESPLHNQQSNTQNHEQLFVRQENGAPVQHSSQEVTSHSVSSQQLNSSSLLHYSRQQLHHSSSQHLPHHTPSPPQPYHTPSPPQSHHAPSPPQPYHTPSPPQSHHTPSAPQSHHTPSPPHQQPHTSPPPPHLPHHTPQHAFSEFCPSSQQSISPLHSLHSSPSPQSLSHPPSPQSHSQSPQNLYTQSQYQSPHSNNSSPQYNSSPQPSDTSPPQPQVFQLSPPHFHHHSPPQQPHSHSPSLPQQYSSPQPQIFQQSSQHSPPQTPQLLQQPSSLPQPHLHSSPLSSSQPQLQPPPAPQLPPLPQPEPSTQPHSYPLLHLASRDLDRMEMDRGGGCGGISSTLSTSPTLLDCDVIDMFCTKYNT